MIKKWFSDVSVSLFCSLLAVVSFISCQKIGIENAYFTYEISPKGKNLGFFDKTSGVDYLYSDTISYCAYVVRDGKREHVQSVSLEDDLLSLDFGDSGVTAKVQIEPANDHVILRVIEVTGSVESLTFLNIPLVLEAMPEEPFAACALSLNLFTHVRQLPALQNNLWATCYQRFGMKNAENKISFSCTGPEDVNTRVQVTVIAHGKPLDIRQVAF